MVEIDVQVPVQEAAVSVEGLSLRYPSQPEPTLANVNFSVDQGQFVCVIGPSGCGKTTLLRAVAGLADASAGQVRVDGARVSITPDDVGIVFQDYGRALCPWRTVVRNVELSLEARRMSRSERRERARAALERVDLHGHDAHYPRQLSGGMQQRLQIARAVAASPRILLMDEPFASLDALTKFKLEDMTLRIWAELGQTVILVTHDLDEALYLADRIILLGGRPSTVVAEFEVPLRRPRDQSETRADPAFVELRRELFDQIAKLGQEPRQ